MQSRTVPFRRRARGEGGGAARQKGVARVVRPSLKPLSAEAKRKRARGREALGWRGGVGIKKDKGKWVGHKTNV